MAISTENLRSPASLARFLLTTIVGFTLDLWTKHIAFLQLASGAPYRGLGEDGRQHWFVNMRDDLIRSKGYDLIPGWLHFRLTVNEGAVFGIGQGQRWLFLVISLAAIFFLSYLFATSGRQRFYQFVLGLLLAGVLGNMYDRVRYGYVRDMIDGLPKWGIFPWIFNVADVLLCVGVAMIFLYSLLHSRPRKPSHVQTVETPMP